MNLFIYEHITSGALLGQPLPTSLAHEGDAMLRAALTDCLALSGHTISIMRDIRLPKLHLPDSPSCFHCHTISSKAEYDEAWSQCLKDSHSIIIAPETQGSLIELQQQAINNDSHVLGCSIDAIALTGNKLTCYQHLEQSNIRTPTTLLASHWHDQKISSPSGYIVKPIDGAGCIDTLFFEHEKTLENYLSLMPEAMVKNTLIQPYLSGDNISLSLLFSEDDVLLLSFNEQEIERDNSQLKLSACIVNGYQSDCFSSSSAKQVAQQIKKAIPGLYGFVGIDLIIMDGDALVIDINPRLTSSYIGLHHALGFNPMSLLLSLEEQDMLALPTNIQRQTVRVTT